MGNYSAATPQDTYSRAIGFRHTYEVPVAKDATFQWRHGYDWLTALEIHAQRFFVVEGRLDGLAYMADSTGELVAAPVIVADHLRGGPRNAMLGSRIVALDFDPQRGYWQSADGIALIKQTADYALHGATNLSIEALFSAIRPGEPPQLTVHLRAPRQQKPGAPLTGEVRLQLSSEKDVVATATVPVKAEGRADLDVPFHQPLPAGFYKISAVYSENGHDREFYQNGFLVTDHSALTSGPVLGVHGDFLTRDGKSFFPVGTNYFTTEENGWDFSGPRNAWIWDRDFAEMAAHGVSFVRTGVWMSNSKFIDSATGGADERFLRNLEAFLDCAHRHNIAINFTFFAFFPQSGSVPPKPGPSSNSSESFHRSSRRRCRAGLCSLCS